MFRIICYITTCKGAKQISTSGAAQTVFSSIPKIICCILSRISPDGDILKHLGIPFDCKLLMHEAIDHCARESGWRTRGILHCRRFYTLRELFLLYKSHVLSFIEYRTPAISHAASSALSLLDCVQERFTRALGVSEEDALLQFCSASLAADRNMAILVLIHRTALRLGRALDV